MDLSFKTAKYLLSVFALLALAACGSSDPRVNAVFKNTTDIKDGELVYMADKVVGEVVDVDQGENGINVVVEIEADRVDAVRGSAALVKNRLKAAAPLEIYNREGDASDLVDGQAITGLDSMFQLGAWMVGDAIKIGGASIGQYVEAFTKYLDSDQFQDDKAKVKTQIDQATKDMSEAVGTVGEQVNQAVKDLADAEGPASEAVKQLGDEISPMVEELAGSGAALIKQIEALTQSLAETQGEEQKAGESFLSTLLETLENLNKSIDKGVSGDTAEGTVQGTSQGAMGELDVPKEADSQSDSAQSASPKEQN